MAEPAKIATRLRAIEIVGSTSTARISEVEGDSDVSSTAVELVCDFCGSPRSPLERQRVVWDSDVGSELVLADLCARCAADADRLLDLYGGRGRDALRITRERRVAALPTAREARARTLAHALLYLVVGLASFILVTLISSLR